MIPDNVKSIMQKLLDSGFEAYIIGGAVRDTIKGLVPHDYDIFTNATGEEILTVFPQGKVIGGEERQAKILTVIVDGVEVSQYRANGNRTETGTSLQDHIQTCDFTINAIAMNIGGEIIDYVNGGQDVWDGILRFVGNPEQRIQEDPLRLFRGIRFAAKYGLSIADKNYFIMFSQYVGGLPKERVRDELMKIIVLSGGIRLLDSFGMMEWIIPEWSKLDIDGGPHHNESVKEHSLMALDIAQQYTNNPLLLLSVLLHDISKPESQGVHKVSGLATFYDHHIMGSDYVKVWMRIYRFSDAEIRYVSMAILHHMMGKTGLISQRIFASICNDINSAGVTPEDMLVITFADNQSNVKNPRLKYNEFITNNGFLQRYYEAKYGRYGFNPNDLEISGKDIINILDITGPAVGTIKQELFNMVCDGKIDNRRDRLIEELRHRRDKREEKPY